MAHPVTWPKRIFFYPIGNTPALNVAQDIKPEENADVLLLGSGDCRNILFTIYSEPPSTFDGPNPRKLDFTCCDYEPAIFARNIILFAMMVDGVPVDVVWSIFYHLLLSENEIRSLSECCRKLIDLSADHSKWDKSPYAFIRFATDRSLQDIRRHWELYLRYDSSSLSQRKYMKTALVNRMAKIVNEGASSLFGRAGGPMALDLILIESKVFIDYWTNGICKGKKPNSQPTSHPNPTLAYSRTGSDFDVHYATCPSHSFHLAPTVMKSRPLSLQDINESAKEQFAGWYSAFRDRITLPTPNLFIRFVVGDVLAVTRAFYIARSNDAANTGVPANPWTATPLDLYPDDYSGEGGSPAPLTFNVIDTSNLSDHVGIINILTSTLPLLRDSPSAVLYTNMLLSGLSTGTKADRLSNLACSDIVTLGTLIGLLPLQASSHFSSYCDKHEAVFSSIMSDVISCHHIVCWRRPYQPLISNPPSSTSEVARARMVTCDPLQLADWLYSVYLNMFKDEDMGSLFKNPSYRSLVGRSLIHYSRESLAIFMSFVKQNVNADWEEAMSRLFERIIYDQTLLMGSNNCQDFICQLHIRGLYTVEVFEPPFLRNVLHENPRFKHWPVLPPVICVALKVPRKALRVLEDVPLEEIGSPIIQCESRGPDFHNIHSSIHCCFGDYSKQSPDPDSPSLTIHLDPKEWDGTSPLIVTFYMPTWILTKSPNATSIGLHVRSTPSTIPLIGKLGMMYTIFSASIQDREHIRFAFERPGRARDLESIALPYPLVKAPHPTADPIPSLNFDGSTHELRSITIRHQMRTVDEKVTLLSGAEVKIEHVSDLAISASFGDVTKSFGYPSAVRPDQAKVRIARKSHYIEVQAPIRRDFAGISGGSLNPFIVSPTLESVNLLNIHRVNLALSPAITLPRSQAETMGWLKPHLDLMFSIAERKLDATSEPQAGGAYRMKYQIGSLISMLVTARAIGCFVEAQTAESEDHRPYALLFFNDLRFDLPNNNVILDACVLPTPDVSNVDELDDRIKGVRLLDVGLKLSWKERVWWDTFLPSMAERCRTWRHGTQCEYRRDGIPAKASTTKTAPFCSCGKGQDVAVLKGTPWEKVASQAHRVAISPLFTFEDVEDSLKDLRPGWEALLKTGGGFKKSKSKSGGGAVSGGCAKCGGPGKPNLLACSACKHTKYCSRECQKTHWKVHKAVCSKST